MHPAASAERVTTSEGKRPPAPWIPLLAWLSLVLAVVIWGASLLQSLERASVGDALQTRQLELEALVQQSPAAATLAPLGIDGADQRLLEHLEALPDSGSAPVLIERALLEQHLGRQEAGSFMRWDRRMAENRRLPADELQRRVRHFAAQAGSNGLVLLNQPLPDPSGFDLLFTPPAAPFTASDERFYLYRPAR